MSVTEDRAFLRRVLEASLYIGLVALLVIWCFQIVRPFITPIVWGVIIAIALHPLYARLCRVMGGRRGLSATILVVAFLAVLLGPSIAITTSLVESATALAGDLEQGTLDVPPPPSGVAEWPVVGDQVHATWSMASENLGAALEQAEPQLRAVGHWILSRGATAGFGIVMFAVSVAIAGVVLSYGEQGTEQARRVARRLVGDRGDALLELTRSTVQSVTRGILGVALIQAFLAGVALIAAAVPAAGLWALLVLFVAVVQIPTLVILLPIVAYVFAVHSTGAAVAFAIWMVAVGASDNVLKPLLLGRGVDTPMLVIFMGAIGGFILEGIIGLFVGAIVLSVGYKLFLVWLEEQPA
jgi:predicted PurR-regulated permease PerM